MTPAPNAISQGSNGAGGGALTAFKGISAAKADPVNASTAATKTILFMKSPPHFQISPAQGSARDRIKTGGKSAIWSGQAKA
jgi:hypothetical protein